MCFGTFLFSNARCPNAKRGEGSLFVELLLAQVLDVDGLQVLLAVDDTGLGELLTTAHLFHHAGFLEFAFQFLESSFEVVTFFNRNYDHC